MAFRIIKDYRNQTDSVRRPKACPKNYKSSTKNNIHHFAAITKRILQEACEACDISQKEFSIISKGVLRATGLQDFASAISAPAVRKILMQSCENGQLLRALMLSDIENFNKSCLMSYVNIFMNCVDTGHLERWIVHEPKKANITQ
jgi:hypothetical protein